MRRNSTNAMKEYVILDLLVITIYLLIAHIVLLAQLVIKEDQYFKNSIASNIFMLNEFVKKLDKPVYLPQNKVK